MKRLSENPRLAAGAMFISAFAVLWAVWYFGYHYFLIWLEGFSYFSDLPDFTSVMLDLPADISRYAGAFLLQFFRWPVLGAIVMSLLAVGTVLCVNVIVRRLFDKPDALFWIAFIPLPFIVYFQQSDLTLSVSLTWLFISSAVMILSCLATVSKKSFIRLPAVFSNIWLACGAAVISLAVSCAILLNDKGLSRYHEDIARLEYHAEHQEWDEILGIVSAQDAASNEYKRKYALLALSETDRLPDFAFRYGLCKSDDFTFNNIQEPYCLNFNMLFYKYLGMYNYQIYQIYQQAVQSVPGMSFDSLRELADAYLKLKDYDLAGKYIDILSHSTCHGSWVKERLPLLEAIRDAESEYSSNGPQFPLISFLPDVSSMYDRYPQNPKFAHYLLCGILAEKDGNTFYNVFQIIAANLYGKGEHIPRLYQEALLLNASKNPEILNRYLIEKEIWERFVDFTSLMEQGKTALANSRYPETYWAYVY